jgi:hypothetical protein
VSGAIGQAAHGGRIAPHTNFSKLPSLRTAISEPSQLSQQLVPRLSTQSLLVLQAVAGLVRRSVTLH